MTPVRERIAYLPQIAEIDRSFPIDVRDCVLLGCWGQAGAWGGVNRAMLGQVASALQAVGLEGFERRSVGSLSSGQLQRVLFARLLVQDAELILLDEPFNAIDAKTTAALLARELVGWGATGEVLTEANLRRARAMAEAWDESAEPCHIDALAMQKAAA